MRQLVFWDFRIVLLDIGYEVGACSRNREIPVAFLFFLESLFPDPAVFSSSARLFSLAAVGWSVGNMSQSLFSFVQITFPTGNDSSNSFWLDFIVFVADSLKLGLVDLVVVHNVLRRHLIPLLYLLFDQLDISFVF